jgi:adenosylcobinamide kinase/adenosylcobinamide-phosphate guanylyltransferase
MTSVCIARSELILGGQKSGKTARAEALAASWLAQSSVQHAIYIATALAWDDEMRERIAHHRRQRAMRLPAMRTVEEPAELAYAIRAHSRPDTLVVVDCLTLWLTGLLMPAAAPDPAMAIAPGATAATQQDALLQTLGGCPGPVVLVSNEIGLGVIPLGRDVRSFVDALGLLNQRVALACERVTLMAAGLPLTLKGAS